MLAQHSEPSQAPVTSGKHASTGKGRSQQWRPPRCPQRRTQQHAKAECRLAARVDEGGAATLVYSPPSHLKIRVREDLKSSRNLTELGECALLLDRARENGQSLQPTVRPNLRGPDRPAQACISTLPFFIYRYSSSPSLHRALLRIKARSCMSNRCF